MAAKNSSFTIPRVDGLSVHVRTTMSASLWDETLGPHAGGAAVSVLPQEARRKSAQLRPPVEPDWGGAPPGRASPPAAPVA